LRPVGSGVEAGKVGHDSHRQDKAQINRRAVGNAGMPVVPKRPAPSPTSVSERAGGARRIVIDVEETKSRLSTVAFVVEGRAAGLDVA